MIEIISFTKDYVSRPRQKPLFSVTDVNALVPDGKITGLLGANGSGKSTILKACCAFHYPTKGRILVSDADGNKTDVAQEPQKAMTLIGYVPEKAALPPDMYVKEFLEYACEIHHIPGNARERAIATVCEECALEPVRAKKIRTLSKGFQQRLSFAQALLHNPPNLILDEPSGGLDPAQLAEMRNLIRRLAQKKAVFLSTHSLPEAEALCDSIYIMKAGRLAASGTRQEILKKTGAGTLEQAFMRLTADKEP